MEFCKFSPMGPLDDMRQRSTIISSRLSSAVETCHISLNRAEELLGIMQKYEERYRLVEKGEAGSLQGRLIAEPGAGLSKNLTMPILRLLSPLFRHRL